ncbi:MAG: Na+/H+ antiporter NhaA [Pseudomonadota bacterium]
MDATHRNPRRRFSMLRDFLDNASSGGIVLMAAAAAAILIANSPASDLYFGVLKSYIGPLSVLHWINDLLMALFFLLVGLEIKREVLQGQLSRWSRRVLPGVGALGGMVVPALIYVAFNAGDPQTLRGWAIPTATDIAFALGVLSLLGSRIPSSLKVFLTALAIIDDLGAVLIIALFYTSDISLPALAAAAALVAVLVALNRFRVHVLWPYLLIGAGLWVSVLLSGVHATIAGVVLALTIPAGPAPADEAAPHSPLHRLEHGLHHWVVFLIIPIFGFANAGVRLIGLDMSVLWDHLTLGVALGLVAGKAIGVFGAAMLAIRFGLTDMPMGAGRLQMLGIALLCGIGFTMSLFIGMLAFADNELLQQEVKIGILAGSLVAGLAGWLLLRFAPRQIPPPGTK